MYRKNKIGKVYTYVCDACEDWHYSPELLENRHMHCECGGHLYLRKVNRFKRIKNYSDCLICGNRNTIECTDCSKYRN